MDLHFVTNTCTSECLSMWSFSLNILSNSTSDHNFWSYLIHRRVDRVTLRQAGMKYQYWLPMRRTVQEHLTTSEERLNRSDEFVLGENYELDALVYLCTSWLVQTNRTVYLFTSWLIQTNRVVYLIISWLLNQSHIQYTLSHDWCNMRGMSAKLYYRSIKRK